MTTSFRLSLGLILLALLGLLGVVSGCSEEVTVVAVDEAPTCVTHEKYLTTFDGPSGRFKRCGKWGTPGERFMFNRSAIP